MQLAALLRSAMQMKIGRWTSTSGGLGSTLHLQHSQPKSINRVYMQECGEWGNGAFCPHTAPAFVLRQAEVPLISRAAD
eukprot:5857066-Amphidinium_carterae.2